MRKKTLKVAFDELTAEVDSLLANNRLSYVQRFHQAMPLVSAFLNSVKQQRLALGFKDESAEIEFFKLEKPSYYAFKIYVVGWFTLMNGKPIGTASQLHAYYSEELRFVQRFFRQHAFHYHYFKSRMSEMDHLLFLRGVEQSTLVLPEWTVMDASFCTTGDYLFAKFKAYERLQDLILQELRHTPQDRSLMASTEVRTTSKVLDWTGEVVNLVELGYGLYTSGQIGGGKASLAEIFRWLESSFGLSIGIPANRLREIKRRKRMEKLHFILLMQEMLSQYIDESEGLR
jgi:hypothetical protein